MGISQLLRHTPLRTEGTWSTPASADSSVTANGVSTLDPDNP